MANYKKFIFVSNAAGTVDGTAYASEATKFAYILSQANTASGKWYKSIIFRAATNEIYNRGQKYGLSVADAQRITDLETAKDALVKAQLAVKSGDKVLAIEEGTGDNVGKKYISSTLSLDYDDTNKKIQLKGIGSAVVAELDAKKFIKDGMVNEAKLVTNALTEDPATEGDSTRPEVPYIKLSFNTDVDGKANHDVIRFSVKSLVDIYTAANVNLTNAYAQPNTFTAANVKSGASMETVVGELMAGIKEAKDNAGVTSVGGKTGAITLKGDLTANGTINLAISEDGQISATINGLGSAAYTNSDAYATAAQGATADSAIQTLTIAGKTLNKTTGTLTAEEIASALSMTDYAKKADTISAASTDLSSSVFTKVTLGGTVANPTVAVAQSVVALGDAVKFTKNEDGTFTAPNGSVANDGLVKASDVASEVAKAEEVIASALNDHESRIDALEGGSIDIDEVSKSATSGNVTVEVKTEDGSVKEVNVTATNAVYNATSHTFTTEGLVTSQTLQTILDDCGWEEL